MEPRKDDQLLDELRALRPTPRPEFAAELDERAAAGFPRRSRPRDASPSSPFEDLLDRLRSLGPRRLLLPAAGFAVLAIAVATAVIAASESDESRRTFLSAPNPQTQSDRSAGAPEHYPGKASAGAGEGGAASAAGPAVAPEEEAGVQYEAEVPSVPPSAGDATEASNAVGPSPAGGFDRRHRAVERAAQIVLGADPADVDEDAAEVFEAVRSHDGIVMRSSTREGKPGQAGARFELLIPSDNLGAALGDLSAIDEVRSRHETTTDITAPTVQTGELLRDSKARIDSLLGQLAEADTESEREAVEAELRQERRHRAALRAQLQNLDRRANLSRVSLRIVTGGADERAGAAGAWGIGDALDDAGHILTIAAAVTLAVLGPIALIALLAHRAWVRRERRRVLG
ncbi:MAG TPA: DUF4349 domain-containing protein [Solirubrobacterales bacterium]|nr:DUF4349 domain-containing protein [Solirubrobacterales bacterium]